jgi:hypothetical protein
MAESTLLAPKYWPFNFMATLAMSAIGGTGEGWFSGFFSQATNPVNKQAVTAKNLMFIFNFVLWWLGKKWFRPECVETICKIPPKSKRQKVHSGKAANKAGQPWEKGNGLLCRLVFQQAIANFDVLHMPALRVPRMVRKKLLHLKVTITSLQDK